MGDLQRGFEWTAALKKPNSMKTGEPLLLYSRGKSS